MKAFNLRPLSVICLSLFSLTLMGQQSVVINKKSSFLEDSQFHNILSNRYEIKSTERRELDYLHALHDIDDLWINYPELGVSVLYSNTGQLNKIMVLDPKCGVDYSEIHFVERMDHLCSKKNGYELLNYGVIYQKMQKDLPKKVLEMEVAMHNKGFAWNGGSRPSSSNSFNGSKNSTYQRNSGVERRTPSPRSSSQRDQNLNKNFSGGNVTNPSFKKTSTKSATLSK